MADSHDELDPTQATEAKLCAYLEGTLSAGERVEIEKYLTQSPTHRKLLRDLAATREWVSNLPKELAPPEIAELFEQHAERTMLLDDSASPVSVAVNRGPQVMLAAAILLLAVGLGAIIFIVLNAKGPTAQNYASSMKSTPVPTTAPAPIPGTVARSSVPLVPPLPPVPPAASPPAMPMSSVVPAPVLPVPKATTLPTSIALAQVPTKMLASAGAASTQSYAMRQQKSMNAPASSESLAAAVNNSNTFVPSVSREPFDGVARKLATTQAPSTTAPATQPTTTVAFGDRLSVDIPQLVGPGVEKTTTVRVEPDGKITLPMLDAMPAAGKTTLDLQKQIADRYRHENLIANPIVTVTKVGPFPSSMPATQPGTKPTTRPAR